MMSCLDQFDFSYPALSCTKTQTRKGHGFQGEVTVMAAPGPHVLGIRNTSFSITTPFSKKNRNIGVMCLPIYLFPRHNFGSAR